MFSSRTCPPGDELRWCRHRSGEPHLADLATSQRRGRVARRQAPPTWWLNGAPLTTNHASSVHNFRAFHPTEHTAARSAAFAPRSFAPFPRGSAVLQATGLWALGHLAERVEPSQGGRTQWRWSGGTAAWRFSDARFGFPRAPGDKARFAALSAFWRVWSAWHRGC